MKLVKRCRLLALGILFSLAVGPVAGGTQLEVKQGRYLTDSKCYKNLAHLEDEMEVLLKSVYVKEFREAVRRSLQAGIPEALSRIDGLKNHIAFLRQEIQHQERVEKSAEFILRDITETSDGPFKPCRPTEEGGYCETLERYYMAQAANLANRGFLEALECYQKHKVH